MSEVQMKQFPKIDLHCHLDGSLPLGTVRELLNREVQIEELQVADDCQNLAQYLEKFELPLQCLQTEKGLEMASYQFMESVAKEGIKYIEVRFAPLLSVHQHLSCRQVIEAVLQGLKKGGQAYGVYHNVIVCAMRHLSDEQNIEMIKTAREFFGNGVCALDLAGDEAAYPMVNFRELFAQANRWELPFTIHAGECGSVENIIEAISCGARRIGHGIALSGNPLAQKLCQEKRIGIEMCPVSNMQTKAVVSLEVYPINEFLNQGLAITINTDNRTVSNTSITREIAFVKKHWKITDENIEMMMKNAVELSFAEDGVKQQLFSYF